MFWLRRPSEADLQRVLEAARAAHVTYAEIGATEGTMPPGYRHDRRVVDLPGGEAVFRRAADGVFQWQPQRSVGATVTPDDPPVEGATVIVTVRVGLLFALAPCRIVRVIDGPDRYGFAYGSLPGHPEEGEESFVVERREGRTSFVVTAFSRWAEPLARLGGPVTRAVQLRTMRGYVEGLSRWATTTER